MKGCFWPETAPLLGKRNILVGIVSENSRVDRTGLLCPKQKISRLHEKLRDTCFLKSCKFGDTLCFLRAETPQRVLLLVDWLCGWSASSQRELKSSAIVWEFLVGKLNYTDYEWLTSICRESPPGLSLLNHDPAAPSISRLRDKVSLGSRWSMKPDSICIKQRPFNTRADLSLRHFWVQTLKQEQAECFWEQVWGRSSLEQHRYSYIKQPKQRDFETQLQHSWTILPCLWNFFKRASLSCSEIIRCSWTIELKTFKTAFGISPEELNT